MSEARTAGDAGPLSGLGVLVTRDVRQAPELSRKLKALGANVFEFPVIEIRHPQSIERLEQLDATIRTIGSYDWIVFASTNAVDFFLSRAREILLDEPVVDGLPDKPVPESIKAAFPGCLIGAVGEKTAERIEQNGLTVAFHPKEFSGDAFAREIVQAHQVEGKKFLWPRTNVGETQIKDHLQQHGAAVDVVVAYETCLSAQARTRAGELRELLNSGAVSVVTLTSTQSVRNFYSIVRQDSIIGQNGSGNSTDGDAPRVSFQNDITIATIGSETAKAARQHFDCRIIQAALSTIDGLTECIARR